MDQNKISDQIILNFWVKIIKLTIVIMNICYFTGVSLYICVEFVKEHTQKEDGLDFFYDYYNLIENSHDENIVIGFYFAITTLSTVGLGDYTPRNNEERVLGVVFLFSGVAIFTFLAGKLTKNLSTYQDLMANFDDGETLMMFFGTLRNFNDNKSITLSLKKDMESYFDYKWNNDRNIAF